MPLSRNRRLAYGLAALTGLIASIAVAVQPTAAATGIRVAGGVLVGASGTPLKLRGINHAHTWYASQTSSFANIKAAGANSVRVGFLASSSGTNGAPALTCTRTP